MLHNCLAKINRMDLNSLKRNQNDIVEVTILYAASVEFFAMFQMVMDTAWTNNLKIAQVPSTASLQNQMQFR